MVMYSERMIAPEPLPATLAAGTRTIEITTEGDDPARFRWTLATEAELRSGTEYVGDWLCEGRKATSFVRYTLVDWSAHQWSVDHKRVSMKFQPRPYRRR